VLAQALEYAAWLDSLTHDAVKRLANSYLQPRSLAEAWAETFASEVEEVEGETAVTLPINLQFNSSQRIFVVVEGNDDRITAVARYLRTQGVDINLIEYRYYRIETGEEMIDFELIVGPEQDTPAARKTTSSAHYTEEAVYTQWLLAMQKCYFQFRKKLLASDENLQIFPQRTAISFYKQMRDARVYICSIDAHGKQLMVSFRMDSLDPYIDIETAVANITQQAPSNVSTKRGKIWFTMKFIGAETAVDQVADLIISNLIVPLNLI